jgi:hypothetical protein
MPPLRLIALAVCCLGLAACTQDAAAPTDGSPAATAGGDAGNTADAGAADAGSAPAGDFRVVSVLLGKSVDADNVVIGDSRVFARKDRIHASVLSTGASQGLRLSAKWLAPDGQAIAETAKLLVPTDAVVTTFILSNARPWPAGDYQLEIAINGRTEQTRTFHIR